MYRVKVSIDGFIEFDIDADSKKEVDQNIKDLFSEITVEKLLEEFPNSFKLTVETKNLAVFPTTFNCMTFFRYHLFMAAT